MDAIKNLLVDHVGDIEGRSNEMAILPYKMYEIIETYLEDIVDLNWASETGMLSILGGIMINCDGARTDMFLPLKFEVRSKKNGKKDLTEECFGFKPYKSTTSEQGHRKFKSTDNSQKYNSAKRKSEYSG